MIDEHTIELIQTGLDGELDDAGRAELENLLAQSEEARQYQAQMSKLSAFLDRAPEQEVPEGLREKILDGIRLPASRTIEARSGIRRIPGFLRYGLTAAAGLLLAFGVYEYRPGQDGAPDISDMAGTVMPGGNTADEVTIDSYSFEIEQLSSSVSLRERDGVLVLDVLLDSTGPGEITINFTGDGLQFDTITQVDSDLSSIEVAGPAVQVKGRGRQRFSVLLHRDDRPADSATASIKLEYSGDGKLLKSGKLTTN